MIKKKPNELVTYIAFNIQIGDVENKIPDISRLGTNTGFDAKSGEVEDKIPDISGLGTHTAFITKTGEVEKKFLIMLNILPLANSINSSVKKSMQN